MQSKFYWTALLFISCLFGNSVIQAQAPGFLFKKAFGGSNEDNVITTKQTLDGGFILAGVTASRDGDVKGFHGGTDVLILKLNSTGNLQWQVCLGGGNTEKGTVIHELTANINGQLQNDGYIIGASTLVTSNIKGNKGSTSDMWVVRINSTGAIVWQRNLGGSGADELISLKPSPDGGFIVTGRTESTNGDVIGHHGLTDILVVKLSAGGTSLWRKTLGNTGSEIPLDLQVLNDGRSVILSRISQSVPGGDITEYRGNYDHWISCLSSSGSLLWQRTVGGSGYESTWCMLRKASDGNLVVAGNTNSTDGDFAGIKLQNYGGYSIIKLNSSDGSILWKWADNSGNGNLFGMNTTNDGGFILAGSGSDGNAATPSGGKLVKVSAAGITQWSMDYGYPGKSELHFVQETTNGDFLALGFSMAGETPGIHKLSATEILPDLWVLRAGTNGVKIWDYAYGGTNEDWYGGFLPSQLDFQLPLNNYWDHFLDANGNIFTAEKIGEL